MDSLIYPNWPQPETVMACSTTRIGGDSLPPYDSFNLGLHVGDQARLVKQNRNSLMKIAQLPTQPSWLNQVHGTRIIDLAKQKKGNLQADAAYSCELGQVCVVMTADCLPVLLCNEQGTEIAAVHAGWRGLCDGILEKAIKQFKSPVYSIMAWLGPAIGAEKFEVGSEVRSAFIEHSAELAQGFKAFEQGKYLADLYLLARLKLNAMGVQHIYGGTYCTMSEPTRFFSYRRDGVTGRMASLIWLK
ncbi:purine nucleoside phosphorylase YfiH [Arsenophonus sp. aPb]|uniref:purine nucleoside phosphorylase YfiH n=1 Tax=Arsenophonus sp. aPb TaxID=3041619 RepID=UPI00246831FC|nr:purine nucleoside phosphorylase YfiH [Arsenophonus sp. aPb]WGL99057.1 purine nucleoside phosphorylase YfiH [Arsenophonus sp. aPb]